MFVCVHHRPSLNDTHLGVLQAAFTAWNPKLRLSTTALMKTSIARIFMMKEARAAVDEVRLEDP